MSESTQWGATPDDWTILSVVAGLTDDLLPVVSNPGARIDPDSKLKTLGKVPSIYNNAGLVAGIGSWTSKHTTLRDIDRWSVVSDLGICVQTRVVRALDVDIENDEAAGQVFATLINHFGQLPTRCRNDSGKFLMAFTLSGEFTKRVLKTAHGAIEFLANGQQFVACGTHPKGARYEWMGGTPMDFPVISTEAFEACWAELVHQFGTEEVIEYGAGRELREARRAVGVADDVADHLHAQGWVLSCSRDGRLNIRCPFEHEHSGPSADDTATQYMPKGVGGFEQGHFHCLHAHCAGRNDGDFLEAIGAVAAQFEVVEYAPEEGEVESPAFARNIQTGKILTTIGNVMLALRAPDWLGVEVAFDDFRSELMITPVGRRQWRPFTDADYTRLRLQMEARGIGVGTEMMREAVGLRGDENRFDSAILWLTNEVPVWDGVPRIDTFYPAYWGTEDNPYTRAVGAYTWTALAGRVLSPGCQADMVPILFGGQGIGKSRGVAAMVPSREFFAELDLSDRDTDKGRLMRGKLIGELGELKGLHSREIESIKSFITSEVDEWTPKYKEFAIKMKRRLIFMGTTNRREFLADETGNRRWLPLEATKVDRDALVRDRLQLWAEARQRFSAGGVEFAKAEHLATDHHDDYRIRDMWEETVTSWLHEEDGFGRPRPIERELTAAEVLVGALKFEPKSVKRGDEMRLGKVLSALGFTSKQLPPSRGRHRVWFFTT